jgi:arsenate reductase
VPDLSRSADFRPLGIEDPAAIEGPEERRRRVFHDTLSYLSRRIDLMLALPFESFERRAAEDRMRWLASSDENVTDLPAE